MLFAVEGSSFEGEAVLVLHGELDLWTQSQFTAALTTVEDDYERVVLDFEDLDFIDAGSIGLIHRARALALLRGVELVIRSPNPHVFRLLELTGLGSTVAGREEGNPIILPLPSRAYERAARYA